VEPGALYDVPEIFFELAAAEHADPAPAPAPAPAPDPDPDPELEPEPEPEPMPEPEPEPEPESEPAADGPKLEVQTEADELITSYPAGAWSPEGVQQFAPGEQADL
jgi:hypothetical protein